MEPGSGPVHAALVLFGRPQLQRDGAVLHVGTRKALALLAVLALDGAQARERLATLLWPELDAAAARRNLRRELFRLRGLGVTPVAAANGALALAGTLQLDVDVFRAALAAGDDASALQAAASSLLDGCDGTAGTEFDTWLAASRSRLLGQRHAARQRHADSLQQRGENAAALALHLQALAEDPCAEGPARLAMQLFAEAGDRASALALYNYLKQALQAELGLTPDVQTVALATRLRQPESAARLGESALAAAAAPRPAAVLLGERLPFVGRFALRQRIEAAWAAGRQVYLSGAPGIGKTRLASECAAGQGAWLRVACAPDDAELPYSSAVRALRALLDAASDVMLPDWVRRELAVLLPELLPEPGGAPTPLPSAEAADRLHAAFASAWQLLLQGNFNALLLDDWQWGDAASVDLWNRYDGSAGTVRWVVVYRSAQLPPAALQRVRRDVDSGRAVTIGLEGLDADEALALVRVLSGSAGGLLFAQRLQRATEGNPFFLIETLRHLFEQGQLRMAADGTWQTDFDEVTQDYAELPVPASVRDAVLSRVRALGEPARRLLEAASLAGETFDLGDLDGVTPLAAEQSVLMLEHAQAARLLMPAATGYRFAHDLVRQCLADSLSPARRRMLHTALALRLAHNGAPPALVALQHESAGQPREAIAWRVRAAEAAWRVHALADVQHQYGRAIVDGAAGAQAVAVQLALLRLHRRLANAVGVADALTVAVQAAQDADAATRLEVQLAIAEDRCISDRCNEGLALLDALAADLAAAPATWRARALTLRARMQSWQGHREEAAALRRTAIELLEGQPGALVQQADLLDDAARAAAVRGDMVNAELLIRRAIASYEAADQSPALASALTLLGVVLLHLRNDRHAAEAAFDRARALAARCGHVPAQRGAILNLIKLHTDAGRAADALALLEEGEALAPGFEHQRAEQAFLQARYFVHYLRGDIPEATAAADRLMALARRVGERRIHFQSAQMVVDLYLHTGRLDAAAALLDEAEAVMNQGDTVDAALRAKRAWWLLASGQAAAALRHIDSAGPPGLEDERWLLGWIGAAAALAIGEPETARRRLDGLDIESESATDALAMVLVQRLALARASASIDEGAAARARALLQAGQVPALEAACLRAALR